MIEINGHHFEQIANAYALAQAGDYTVGHRDPRWHRESKGLSLAEGVHTWHSIVPSADDFEKARQELEADELELLDAYTRLAASGDSTRPARTTPRPAPRTRPAPYRRNHERSFSVKGSDVWGEKLVELGHSPADGGPGRRFREPDQGRQVRQSPPGPVPADGHRGTDLIGAAAGLAAVGWLPWTSSFACPSPTVPSTRSGCRAQSHANVEIAGAYPGF